MKFEATFGALIAFLLPGFVCLYGLSFSVTRLTMFVAGGSAETESAGFFYTLMVSLSFGLIVSAIRWAIIDKAFEYLFKLKWPKNVHWDRLNDEKTLASFQFIVQNHYHYYQYYSNTFVALLISATVYELRKATLGWWWVAIAAVLAILIFGSFSTLSNYFKRGALVLGSTDGGKHDERGGESKEEERRREKEEGKSAKPHGEKRG